jgi:S-disulfanyl-L-cysteine oxidoreductase SoxD
MSRGQARALLAVLLLAGTAAVVVTGCSVPPSSARAEEPSQASSAEAQTVHFGFGSPAPDPLIEAWDIDVRPDGEGLPPGNGSVTEGRAVFGAVCARCHGPTGREGPNDRLAGEPLPDFSFGRSPRLLGQRTVGNYWPYATTLFDYIRRAMPFDAPGTLTPAQIYSAVAYVLYLNGLVPEDTVLDARTLPEVQMPARDRFVPDDRSGGSVVR